MPTLLPVRQRARREDSELWAYLPIALAAMLLSIVLAIACENTHTACLVDEMGPLIPAEIADLCR